MDNKDGKDANGMILSVDTGADGGAADSHTRSPTGISFAPSETTTVGGSAFVNKGGSHLEGLPETAPFQSSNGGGTTTGYIPNIFVPKKRPQDGRTLVLCFDGTGDQFDADNSNIVEMFSILRKDDPERQLVYYQAGIGTYTVPQIATPFMARLSKTLDMMIAWNLDAHIMGGYEFLMQNYKAGDKICIFGFSRGAYTARCLAGMIHKVGLLPTCNHQQVPFAYKMYTRTDPLGWKQSNAFKAAFSTHVDIEFLGVWDTVNSVGIIPRRLPFTTSNTCVRVFRHAISLDERRAKFKQNTWNRPHYEELLLAESDQVQAERKREEEEHDEGDDDEHHDDEDHKKKKKKKGMKQWEREYSDNSRPTDVDEVWFAGCHTDIGGGSVTNGIRPNLARIPLRWMIRQTFAETTGIMFSARGLRRMGFDLDPNTFHPILNKPPPLPLPPNARIQHIPPEVNLTVKQHVKLVKELAAEEIDMSEREIDLRDALSPIYDQLKLAKWWWILEFLPLRHRYQKDDDLWISYLHWNMGKGRHIPKQKKNGVKVHRSVQVRMEAAKASGEEYYPNANLKLEKVIWVD